MKSIGYLITVFLILLAGCGPSTGSGDEQNSGNGSGDDAKGAFTYVDISDPLEEDLISQGRSIYENQCSKCHNLDTVTFTGPGWAGITNRRDPDWIMNMILNVNLMLEVDSLAHTLLLKGKEKMPEQGLTVDKARAVLEYMRKNDLQQTGTKDEGVKD